MKLHPPPPVLYSARVLTFAFVDDIPYRRWGSLYVGGELLEAVPCLAIATSLEDSLSPMLFYCDQEWNVLGATGGTTLEALQERAERNYPGAALRWVVLNTSVEAALAFLDAESGGAKCTACGKRPFELDGWVEENDAIICLGCIEHRALNLAQG